MDLPMELVLELLMAADYLNGESSLSTLLADRDFWSMRVLMMSSQSDGNGEAL